MLLERWDPFRELHRSYRWGNVAHPHAATSARVDSWRIPLDVVRDGESVIVEASIPGVRPEDISVTIEDGVLRIEGQTASESERTEGTYLLSERRTGSFHRSIRLPESVDADNASTSYEAGVLTITLPKVEAKKAKQLTIEVKNGKELAEA